MYVLQLALNKNSEMKQEWEQIKNDAEKEKAFINKYKKEIKAVYDELKQESMNDESSQKEPELMHYEQKASQPFL